MVAPTLSGARSTNAAASWVVMCSTTIFSFGKRLTSGARVRSTKTASRSNTSTSASVTSPCTSSGMPAACMASSTASQRRMSVTPEAELVVAPAG